VQFWRDGEESGLRIRYYNKGEEQNSPEKLSKEAIGFGAGEDHSIFSRPG